MDVVFVYLIGWIIPLLLGFVVIYYAVRLAIRHERDWERRNRRPE